jgi:hypothetical protein
VCALRLIVIISLFVGANTVYKVGSGLKRERNDWISVSLQFNEHCIPRLSSKKMSKFLLSAFSCLDFVTGVISIIVQVGLKQ